MQDDKDRDGAAPEYTIRCNMYIEMPEGGGILYASDDRRGLEPLESGWYITPEDASRFLKNEVKKHDIFRGYAGRRSFSTNFGGMFTEEYFRELKLSNYIPVEKQDKSAKVIPLNRPKTPSPF